MMFAKIAVLVIATFCLWADHSDAQCVPQSVVNLRLDAHHNLTWSLKPDEPCEVTEYLVYIFHPDQPAEYGFSVTETSVDVSFLEVCEEWTFVVVPLSGSVIGAQRRIIEKLPLPADANLTIRNIFMTHDPYIIRTQLFWNMTDTRIANCSLRFRVTIEQDGSPVIDDFYVEERHIGLHYLASCSSYQFGIRAVNVAPPTIEGPLKMDHFLLPGRHLFPPELIDSQVGSTWVNLSFRTESVIRNPCPLKQMYVEAGLWNWKLVNLTDTEERPPINITLTDLDPNTTYPLKATISNSAGWSDATEFTIQTLEVEQNGQLNKKVKNID